MSKHLEKLLSGSLHGLKAAQKSLAKTVSRPINYATATGHKLKRMEEGILKRVMNNMKTKRNHKKNHRKGGTRRQQRQ
jgi:hypothetical protein